MRTGRYLTGGLAAALMMGAGAPAQAADGAADWQYGLRIYGWLPSVNGSLNLRDPEADGDISVDADEILDALKLTFMASAEARKGRWAGFTDVIYLNLEGDQSKSVAMPSGDSRDLLDAKLKLKGWIWTLGGAYSLWEREGSHLDLLAGARLFNLDVELELTGGGPGQRERDISKSVNLWDGIVGVKGVIALDEHWYLPYYADLGTGDTDLTWAAAAGVAYRFNWGNLVLQYRYMSWDQGSDGLMQDLGFGGPLFGAEFHF